MNEYKGPRRRIYSKEDGPRKELWTEAERREYRRDLEAADNEGMSAYAHREEVPAVRYVDLAAIERRERRIDKTNVHRMEGRE